MKSAFRGLCIVLVLCVFIGIAGCGEDKVVPVAKPITPPDTAAPTETATSGSAEPDAVDGRFDEGDLAIEVGGFRVTLGIDIAEVIAALGEGYEYSEAISCAYDGLDKTFIYPGVEFYTYPDGNKDYLFEVILVDDTYSTAGMLKVGSTEAEITEAYGGDSFVEGIVMRYNASNDPDNIDEPSLYFVMEDGIATSLGIALGGGE